MRPVSEMTNEELLDRLAVEELWNNEKGAALEELLFNREFPDYALLATTIRKGIPNVCVHGKAIVEPCMACGDNYFDDCPTRLAEEDAEVD